MSVKHLSLRGLALLLFTAIPTATFAESHLLVIAGLGGDPQYVDAFHEQALALADAALSSGIPEENIAVLTEEPERASDRIDARSTRDNVLAQISALADRSAEGDQVWVVLIGHGSSSGGVSKLNLPGPDLSDDDYAAALVPLLGRKVVFVNASSASGGFIAKLAGPDRVVVTATRSPGERNETVFGKLFVEALGSDRTDADRDGRISVLEAFLAANREVERYYENEKLLRTEHAVLDDNGDGQGSLQPEALGGEDGSSDGLLAARIFLGGRTEQDVPEELRGVAARRAELAAQLDELRRQKASLSEEVYNQELQRLLLEIARLDAQLREQGEPPTGSEGNESEGNDSAAAESDPDGPDGPPEVLG
ncbi:MAG TPA: hypothetical protein VMT85_16645 [Thermoanaerobaculia bacterium]|nr:hypothetical protein [Thermoanaerobaculia bacterium]